mmetsp:Transcript_6785/g.11408  ORF Transcript_6785/g.11408 Transcript_6785/m.11408 type:complete len:161 (+) Transcript_6785:228-710(+)
MMESPISKKMEKQDSRHQGDELDFGFGDQQKIQGGILKNYRKVADQSLEDIVKGDYWRSSKETLREMAESFKMEDMSEQQMMNFTKNYIARNKLNREIDLNEDFRKRFLTKDYGNFEKYEKGKNTFEVKLEGAEKLTKYDNLYQNYSKILRTLPVKETEY